MAKIGHYANATAFARRHSGSKLKIVKIMRKTTLEAHSSCFVQKTAPKNTYYSKNDNISKMAQIGHPAKAIASAKLSLWLENWNCQRHAKNNSKSTLELLVAKNCSKKQLIIENDNISKMAKIGHHAKAIASANSSL